MEKHTNNELKSIEKTEYCECKNVDTIYTDTESSDFGYWDVCNKCNKKLKDGFHYYNHYDGEDHDDSDVYN